MLKRLPRYFDNIDCEYYDFKPYNFFKKYYKYISILNKFKITKPIYYCIYEAANREIEDIYDYIDHIIFNYGMYEVANNYHNEYMCIQKVLYYISMLDSIDIAKNKKFLSNLLTDEYVECTIYSISEDMRYYGYDNIEDRLKEVINKDILVNFEKFKDHLHNIIFELDNKEEK